MILDDILRDKRTDLDLCRRSTPLAALQGRALYQEKRRGFRAALDTGARTVIAEVKKASPSKGVIRPDFDPVWIANRYAACGASAISVLTEERYFQGSLAYLEAIRGAVDRPLLRKDFLFDSYQLHEARAHGADAVLLIVAMLDDIQLRDLAAEATELGLDTLVEVHDRSELDRAAAMGADLIGINNRNLHTFHVTLATTESLVPFLPPSALVVGESGIETMADIARLERAGVHCFLVGESLMRAPDPGERLRALLERR